MMNWDISEADYPQIKIGADHVIGLSSWLLKIIEMTTTEHSSGPWNVIVCDIWPNDRMSRLIGHVQMNDVRIGYDTGFRVCAYLTGGGIQGDVDDKDDIPCIKNWLEAATARPEVKAKLQAAAEANPFDIRLSSWGDGDLRQITKIAF